MLKLFELGELQLSEVAIRWKKIFHVGIISGGNFPGGGYSGGGDLLSGNYPGGSYTKGEFLCKNCPVGSYTGWEFSLGGVFRVGIVQWESSGWQFSVCFM